MTASLAVYVVGWMLGQAALECDARPNAVTVNPFGLRWAYDSTNPVAVKFHQDGPLVSYTGTDKQKYFNEVTRAQRVWLEVDCDTSVLGAQNPRVSVANDTTTLVTTVRNAADAVNVVQWSSSSTDFSDAEAGVLAYTYTTNVADTYRMSDADMVFNKRHFLWRIQSSQGSVTGQCSANATNCADVFTVALHEYGHFFGLGHVGCANSVMFPTAWVGSDTVFTPASLSESEKRGMCGLYPRAPADLGTLKAPGDRCSIPAECYSSSTYACSGGMCATKCTLDTECPQFHVCGVLGACVPGVNTRGGSRVVPCAAGSWECTDRTCIPVAQVCDSTMQCSDGSDEWSCGCGSADSVRCPGFSRSSSVCISRSQLCDGAGNCGDGALFDENPTYCEDKEGYCSVHPTAWQCETTCASGSMGCPETTACVSRSRWCDGTIDCTRLSSDRTSQISDPQSPDEYACSGHTQSDGTACESCTRHSQCDGLKCVGVADDGICVRSCENNAACPLGFSCIEAQGVGKVCYPNNTSACRSNSNQVDAGEVCYNPKTLTTTDDDEYKTCKGGAHCFVFTQKGVCMPECTAQTGSNGLCPAGKTCCNEGQTCCFGVSSSGSCVQTSSESKVGACFDARTHGSSCMIPSQAVCPDDHLCLDSKDKDTCYARCEKTACAEGETCVAAKVSSTSEIRICCDENTFNPNDLNTCRARLRQPAYDVGVACAQNTECLSGLCYSKVCTRTCDPQWAVSCPDSTVDVNHDGVGDGGMSCKRQLNGKYYCMPKSGVGATPPPYGGTPGPSGCTCKTAQGAFAWAMLGVVWSVWRRRRRLV